MTDARERRMRTLATRIRNCTACDGMNIPEITQAAPGYGSVRSPVMIVGQSLCGPCMATQIPFTGGSGRFLDRALLAPNSPKKRCSPPTSCTVTPGQPALATSRNRQLPPLFGTRNRRGGTTTDHLPGPRCARHPRTRSAHRAGAALALHPAPKKPSATDTTRLLFAPHPSWIARQPRTAQDAYVLSLTAALRWAFACRSQ